jgi:predicted ATPase/DNA-binding SARP family transcriptional activator
MRQHRSTTQAISVQPVPVAGSSYTQLRIRLLGDFALYLDGVLVTSVKSARLQSLLAYLLIHRDAPQTRQHVAFLFWPDSSEAQSQSNLRHLLHSLQRALPQVATYIEIGTRTLAWTSSHDITLDVADFENALASAASHSESEGTSPNRTITALRRAADLYPADLLPGCYDEWVLAPRERLREQFQATLERLVDLLEGRGDLSTAILYAQRLLRQDPLLEENYRRLMRLHLANGDRAGVLNVYKQCARSMKRELGVEPGPATTEIMQQARQASSRKNTPPTTVPAQPQPSSPASAPTSTNLPAQTTVFFGREREMAEAANLLRQPDVRLVTFVGTPGTGKTRLAINVAASLTMAFPDGVFLTPLASVENPGDVIPAIAATLGVTEPAGGSAASALHTHIGSRHMLMVADNFEQILPAGSVLAAMLAACPNLKLLVTSRSALNLRGEHEFVVAPLSVPARDSARRPDDLLQYESVALFLDRALEVAPGLSFGPAEARIVADICRRLEGLPLAIELAAARAKVLSPEAILSRLDRRLKLLTGGRLDLPPRQRALETAIAWSYNLLDEGEKRLFQELSVFSGGWTLESAQSVFGEQSAEPTNHASQVPDVLDGISSLVSKSLLVRTDNAGDEPRFFMLETLKEFAWERLVESHGEAEARRRHGFYFLDFAERSKGEIDGPQQQQWLSKLEREQDNLRTAMSWAIEQRDAELAQRIAGSLGLFWERRGLLTEGRRWLRQALELGAPTAAPCKASALYAAGSLALRQRDYSEAQPLLEEAGALYEGLGDKEGLSNTLSALAIMTLDKDYDKAVDLHLQSLDLRRELGDKLGIARTLQNLGFIKMHQTKWDEASALTQEAHFLYCELGNQSGIAYTVYVLAMIAAEQHETELARARFAECLQISRKMRNDWLTAWALQGLGSLLYSVGEYEEAERTLTEALDMFADLGDKLGTAHALASLGREMHRKSDYEAARHRYGESLALGVELENEGVIGSCLGGFAGLAAASGEPRRAAMLFGCAQKTLEHLSTNLEREQMTLGIDIAQAALTPQEWETAWGEGQLLSPQEAITLAHPTR